MIPRDVSSAARELPIPDRKGVRISPRPYVKNAEIKIAALLKETQNEGVEVKQPTSNLSYAWRDIAKILRWFILSDLAALAAGFVCAMVLAIVINDIYFGREFRNLFAERDSFKLAQFFVISISIGLWFEHKGHYRVRMPFWLEVKKIVGTFAFAMVVDGFLQFASKQDFSRLWLVASWVFTAIFVVLFRSLLRSHLMSIGKWRVPTLLVGGGATAEDARTALKSESSLGYEIISQVKNLPEEFRQAGKSWEAICATHGADYIVVALEGHELSQSEQLFAQLMRENIPFSVSPPLRHLPVLGMTPHYFFNHDVMLLTRNSGLEQPLPRLIKRSFDILVSSTALLLLSPIFLLIAGLIKLDGGNVIFSHERVGLKGKSFSCLKLRSMKLNGDELLKKYLSENSEAVIEWEKDQKLKSDPRITKIGAFIRHTSLDELPQLFNVLKGDMSLVGPRPIIKAEADRYDDDIAHYYKVRPGITGMWQVSGRNEVTYARRVQMDSWYVRNWSLWHDVAIICKTIPVLLKRTGAY